MARARIVGGFQAHGGELAGIGGHWWHLGPLVLFGAFLVVLSSRTVSEDDFFYCALCLYCPPPLSGELWRVRDGELINRAWPTEGPRLGGGKSMWERSETGGLQ